MERTTEDIAWFFIVLAPIFLCPIAIAVRSFVCIRKIEKEASKNNFLTIKEVKEKIKEDSLTKSFVFESPPPLRPRPIPRFSSSKKEVKT